MISDRPWSPLMIERYGPSEPPSPLTIPLGVKIACPVLPLALSSPPSLLVAFRPPQSSRSPRVPTFFLHPLDASPGRIMPFSSSFLDVLIPPGPQAAQALPVHHFLISGVW